jgi:hypothetical protein
MNNSIKLYIIILVIGLGAGSYITKMYFPTTKEVQVEKQIIKNDIKTITKVIEKKDGTKETVTEVTDNSVKQEQKTETKTVNKQKDHHINLGAEYNFKEKKQDYSLTVEKRLTGPLFLGVTGNTNGSVGVTVGLEF